MAENNQPVTVTNDRRRRINRLKKIIIITALILIIIPIILCIFLLFKVSDMQKTIDELVVLKDSGAIIARQDDTGKTYYVYASSLEEKVPNNVDDKDTDTGQLSGNDIPEVETGNQNITMEPTEQVDTGKYVYLTFDDGPSEQTDKILQILKENNVTATFFVIGREDEESYARYKAIVDSGNTIGLHSYTHDYEEIYSSVENFAYDLQTLSDVVYEATGVRSMLYRFPGGSSNSIADDISIFIDYLNENGYTYYDWNSSSRDAASVMPPKEDIINTVVAEVEGKDNVVVLMHDSIWKETTVEALPELILKLKDMGYTIKGIDENSVPVQHR